MTGSKLATTGRGHLLAPPLGMGALQLWERAAETGDIPAAFIAGLYRDHATEKRDQPANPAKAARFYRIAAAKGHVPASSNLGLLRRKSHSLPP
jgi:TPR repeat protein